MLHILAGPANAVVNAFMGLGLFKSILRGKVEEASVCIVSTAAVRAKTDKPFNTEGDATYRVIGS